MTLTNLPTTGANLYVRLEYLLDGMWYPVDTTYTHALQPSSMISPVPNSTLAGTSQTFTSDPGSVSGFLLMA